MNFPSATKLQPACRHLQLQYSTRGSPSFCAHAYSSYPLCSRLRFPPLSVLRRVSIHCGTGVVSSGSKRGRKGRAPPGQFFFIFFQFSGKIGQIVCWHPHRPLGLAHPPREMLYPPLVVNHTVNKKSEMETRFS